MKKRHAYFCTVLLVFLAWLTAEIGESPFPEREAFSAWQEGRDDGILPGITFHIQQPTRLPAPDLSSAPERMARPIVRSRFAGIRRSLHTARGFLRERFFLRC